MLYITATEKTKKSDKVKSSILLTCIGPRGRKVYNTFAFDDNSMKMNFNCILQQFDDFCSPEKNVTVRCKLLSYKQSEGQCFDNFVSELKKLSKECEMLDLQNSLMRDIIVIGITDNHLRQYLLREPALILDSVLKLKINHIYKFRKSHRSWEQNPNLEVIMKCKFCSRTNNKGSCPAYGKICNNCGNKDHFAKCCTKKKSIYSLNQECSDNTAQNDSPNYCQFFLLGLSIFKIQI